MVSGEAQRWLSESQKQKIDYRTPGRRWGGLVSLFTCIKKGAEGGEGRLRFRQLLQTGGAEGKND